jgi:hypothetical protein
MPGEDRGVPRDDGVWVRSGGLPRFGTGFRGPLRAIPCERRSTGCPESRGLLARAIATTAHRHRRSARDPCGAARPNLHRDRDGCTGHRLSGRCRSREPACPRDGATRVSSALAPGSQQSDPAPGPPWARAARRLIAKRPGCGCGIRPGNPKDRSREARTAPARVNSKVRAKRKGASPAPFPTSTATGSGWPSPRRHRAAASSGSGSWAAARPSRRAGSAPAALPRHRARR